MTLRVQIAGEHAGAIEQIEGLVLRLRSPKAFPPGQPLALAFSADGSSIGLDARAIGSKRRDDGSFELRVRLINLRKDAREALEKAWSSIERG
jgi:hypothetical protein